MNKKKEKKNKTKTEKKKKKKEIIKMKITEKHDTHRKYRRKIEEESTNTLNGKIRN